MGTLNEGIQDPTQSHSSPLQKDPALCDRGAGVPSLGLDYSVGRQEGELGAQHHIEAVTVIITDDTQEL